MRESICAELLSRRFDDQFKQLQQDKVTFAEQLYDSWFTVEEMALLTQSPVEWFSYTETIGFTYQGVSYSVDLSTTRRVPENHCRYRNNDLCPKMAKAWQKWKEKDKALTDKRYELKQKCMAVMNSVTTVARLIEIWPELKTFVPAEGRGPAMCTALSIPMKELNEDLGLP
jgi:hypothetical protein